MFSRFVFLLQVEGAADELNYRAEKATGKVKGRVVLLSQWLANSKMWLSWKIV